MWHSLAEATEDIGSPRPEGKKTQGEGTPFPSARSEANLLGSSDSSPLFTLVPPTAGRQGVAQLSSVPGPPRPFWDQAPPTA